MKTRSQARQDWTLVLRRQPVKPARTARGQLKDRYADVYELICCDCGDDPDLDYRDTSPELQQIRGPYPIVDGVAAYERHARRHES